MPSLPEGIFFAQLVPIIFAVTWNAILKKIGRVEIALFVL